MTPFSTRLLCGALLVVCGFYFGWTLKPQAQATDGGNRTIVAVVHDTTTQVVYRDRVELRNLPARLVIKHVPMVTYIDSISHDTLVAPPFSFVRDTIIRQDTFQLRADYPPPSLSMTLRHRPDSVQTITTTKVVTVQAPVKHWLTLSIGPYAGISSALAFNYGVGVTAGFELFGL